jgi:hypothetical protein
MGQALDTPHLNMSNIDAETLAALVDKHGIRQVLLCLSEICIQKARSYRQHYLAIR